MSGGFRRVSSFGIGVHNPRVEENRTVSAPSPSLEDGIDRSVEAQLRAFGAQSIQRAGVLLRLPQITVISAAVMFQRFYCRKSFADLDVRNAAAGAVLLACKLEEQHRKLHDVLVVAHRIQMRELLEDSADAEGVLDSKAFAQRPTPALELGSRDYTSLKEDVVRAERHIFRELGFEVIDAMEHAHKHALRYLDALQRPKALAQQAWNFLNDALGTSLCCEYRPTQLATASIFLAARSLGMKLPGAWPEAIEADDEGLREISSAILAIYKKPAPTYIYVPRRKRLATFPPATPMDAPSTPLPMASPSPDQDADADCGGRGRSSSTSAPRNRGRKRKKFEEKDP